MHGDKPLQKCQKCWNEGQRSDPSPCYQRWLNQGNTWIMLKPFTVYPEYTDGSLFLYFSQFRAPRQQVVYIAINQNIVEAN